MKAAARPEQALPSEPSVFQDLNRGRVVATTVGIMLGLLLASLDQTVVGTALPHIVAELNGLDYYAWVITAYLVASTTMVPIAGKLGDLFGRKPFVLGGMVGFVLASALAGLSQTIVQLVVFRAIQGLFAGILMASVFTVIADLFPPRTRARMQGVFAAVFGISSILGPTLGGYLTDSVGWRWVFYVNVPVGVVAFVVVAATMPYRRTRVTWRHIDLLGALLLVVAVVPLLIALSISNTHPWTSPEMLALLALSLAAGVAFVLVELRTDEPIVPPRLFDDVPLRGREELAAGAGEAAAE